jgi:hypothetical protein
MAGSAALGRGISSGLQNLGAGIQAAMEKKKQEASLATTLRKKLSIIQPERKDEFATMGLADLAGEDLGHAEKIITARNAQHEQLQAEKLAELISRRQGREALPRVYEELSQMGQSPESVPGPFNNAEFDRRTMPLGPEALMSALARSRAPVEMNDAASLMNALERMRPTAPRGLALGVTKDVPGVGTIIGTGENFEPNFHPTPRPTKEPDVEVPTYPWLFSDDKKAFTQGISSLPPKERDAAIAARTSYKRAIGSDDPLREALAALLGSKAGETKGGTGAKSTVRKWNRETGMLDPLSD